MHRPPHAAPLRGGGHRQDAYYPVPPQNPGAVFPYLLPQNFQYYWTAQPSVPVPQPALPHVLSPAQNSAQYQQNPSGYYSQAANTLGNALGTQELLGRVEAALAKAQQDILAAGESVSAWKVSQSALMALKVDSWASLGFQFQDIPYLRRLVATEGKVNAFIHCFVGVSRITTIHDLDVSICNNEGIEQFASLGLGPLLRHPLVIHYFSVPPDTTEIPNISAEGIVSCLSSYMDKSKKVIDVEEFLNFLVEKHAVSTKEKLGVRIRSLGMHIACIRKAKQAEHMILNNFTKESRHMADNDIKLSKGRENLCQPPNMVLEKEVLTKRFDSISKRIKSFSSECNVFEGKHIRFSTSEDEVSESDSEICHQGTSKNNNTIPQRVSSCPYPSTTEERERLGLKSEIAQRIPKTRVKIKRLSGTKRKFREKNKDCTYSSTLREEYQANHGDGIENDHEFVLSSRVMEKFITMWKEACREHSVAEVLGMMLNFYGAKVNNKKKIRKIFSSYPGVGLLNIAVASIKRGMLDSIYEIFQDIGEHKGNDSKSGSLENIEIGSPVKVNENLTNMANTKKIECRVAAEEIIQKMVSYFQCVLPRIRNGHPNGHKLTILRTFHDCEMWLAREFSVDVFGFLGYGNFIEFLEKFWAVLPSEAHAHIVEESCRSHLEVAVNQLQVFLSQAEVNLTDSGSMTKSYILRLLEKQFPALCLEFVGDEAEGHFQQLVRKQKENAVSVSVFYSTTLLGKFSVEKSRLCTTSCSSKALGTDNDIDIKVSPIGSVSGEDAIQCLCKAPMLADLLLWSHWDMVYAPTLGPLLTWLPNQIHSGNLSCIATSDGRIVRIDHTVTVEDFLEASIQNSPFHSAVKLLSLLALYGGTKSIPLALLKCYAQRAVDVIIKNSTDLNELNKKKDCFFNESSFKCPDVSGTAVGTNRSLADNWGTLEENLNKGINAAAMFILNCLEHLPSEFRIFAVEVWISGLRSFTKDASLVMLHQCRQVDQRIMLHDVGLSLGIVEWIEDYNIFISAASVVQDSYGMGKFVLPGCRMDSTGGLEELSCSNFKTSTDLDSETWKSGIHNGILDEPQKNDVTSTGRYSDEGHHLVDLEGSLIKDASLIIESIRHEEFGLNANSSHAESNMLKKQHERLGRALHCLSQELYSQDSHLLLELVQNADDNTYAEAVEPTLIFILQPTGIVVLNNELGFSADNIRALCDIGNSTKKGSTTGYIGHKGIGFKSVFRVTDAPEIHSNGFHVKFDITEGQIGFVLPTVIPPCDVNFFEKQITSEVDKNDVSCWNTCIVLPFRSKLQENSGMSSIVSMFSDLHPSLLLFLHRLQCIKLRNMLTDSFITMRKETLCDGIIKVSFGANSMNWLVVRRNLKPGIIRPDVQTTEIAVAFTLLESDSREYKPCLNQQPVFAFLPLRTYGLKFILQGDFVLPSSREEVDGDSAWNQWLLSEYPDLFVSAEREFVGLPCFNNCPGKAVSTFLAFVPLAGEVHGFFSHLPYMIVSKLRTSSCLLLEDHDLEWVPPCRVIRGWDEQARALLSDRLLQRYLGLGYLNRDILLSDSLAKTLGIREYGPKILAEIITCICHDSDGIQQLGFDWLYKWFITLNNIISRLSSVHDMQNASQEVSDVISSLRNIPLIPLSDGSYGSITEGPIWLSCESFNIGSEGKHRLQEFPRLSARLRMVNPLLFSAASSSNVEEPGVEILLCMLHKIGVQKLSPHEVIKSQIMPALSDAKYTDKDKNLMVEYLSYIMLHFQNSCSSCQVERIGLVKELQNNSIILTNHGYKSPIEEPIHFSREFGNPMDITKLIEPDDCKWNEVDAIYLKHYCVEPGSYSVLKWRDFFQELGVTDFVQVIHVERPLGSFLSNVPNNVPLNLDNILNGSVVNDWESPELICLLRALSSRKQRDKCIYLLEVLDKMWDNCYSSGGRNYARGPAIDIKHPPQSSFLKSLHEFRWIASSMDQELNYPKDLFHDCEIVRSLLGSFAPYAVPQVKCKSFLNDIGFKTRVTFDDAVAVFRSFGVLRGPVSASVVQMSNFYSFVWEQSNVLKVKIMDELKPCSYIFVPSSYNSRYTDIVPGAFFSSDEVCWHDPTGCLDQVKKAAAPSTSTAGAVALSNLYPNLYDFFVGECGVPETPSFGHYIQILLHLSNSSLPSQTAHLVFQVFLRWADELKTGDGETEKISVLTESLRKLENTVLPTVQDKWVSLHPTFGLVCWSDDEEIRNQFKYSHNVIFIHFGELSNGDKDMLSRRVSKLLQRIGVPSLSEVVMREAISYGTEDCREKTYLINWVLPYAQRYLFKFHPDKYSMLKKSVIEKLALLQITVVEKLFYRYSLKGCNDTSRTRCECSCLLQGNVLYMTRTSDPHSIFLELSRIFFDGSANLQFANFLHMITIMSESGSTDGQMEFFIVNSQQVPKLPNEENPWFLPLQGATVSQKICPLPMNSGQSVLSHARKSSIIPNWPPTDWKTAPDFSRAHHFGVVPVGSPYDVLTKESSKPESVVLPEDIPCSIEVSGDWIAEHDIITTDHIVDDLVTPNAGSHSVGLPRSVGEQVGLTLENGERSNSVSVCPSVKSEEFQIFSERNTFGFQALNDDRLRKTGVLGETIAYRYFREKFSSISVRWVNEETETGLPYDLVVEDDEGKREFIEVKTTSSKTKDWFPMTSREWQFAVEKGECYTVAHVVLMGPKNVKITMFKNPLRLCQQNVLHLAVLMSRR